VAEETLDLPLRLVEAIANGKELGKVDKASVIRAAEAVTAAYETYPPEIKSPERFRMVFCIVQAAIAAMSALLAVENPRVSAHEMQCAAEAAERAARPATAVQCDADLVANAARRDFDLLSARYGRHEKVVLGEPIDCFGSE